MVSPQKQQLCSDAGTDCRFAACNHGMQGGMAAMSPLRPVYCTQQTGGLTRGVTLRAIPASGPISSRSGLAGPGVCCNVHLDPQHCVQAATVRFHAAGPSAPGWSDGAPPRWPGGPGPVRRAGGTCSAAANRCDASALPPTLAAAGSPGHRLRARCQVMGTIAALSCGPRRGTPPFRRCAGTSVPVLLTSGASPQGTPSRPPVQPRSLARCGRHARRPRRRARS